MKSLKELRESFDKTKPKIEHPIMEETLELDEKTSNQDIPFMVVLKRRAIRQYPDGQVVALYYSDKLKQYVTVPFSGIGVGTP